MAERELFTTFLHEEDATQAEIYAKDLNELYRAERKKRKELAEERLVLTYKLNELEALNKLFQSHLERRIEIERIYRQLVEQIKELLKSPTLAEMAEGLKSIVERAEKQTSEVESLQDKDER